MRDRVGPRELHRAAHGERVGDVERQRVVVAGVRSMIGGHDVVTARPQRGHQMAADEPARTGDQNAHVRR